MYALNCFYLMFCLLLYVICLEQQCSTLPETNFSSGTNKVYPHRSQFRYIFKIKKTKTVLEMWLSKERLLSYSTPRFLIDDEELPGQP